MRERMSLFGIDMAPRANRRWLVAITYLTFMIATVFAWRQDSGSAVALLIMLGTIVNGLILGGYGRRGLIKPFVTRLPFGSPTPWHNDERDVRQRDRVHFHAYRFVVALLLLGAALGGAPFQRPEWSRALLLVGVVLGLTLPQAILLWMDADMEFERPDTAEAAASSR